MSDSVKASRAIVQIGTIQVDGFMLPDGSYRMSQTQAAESIGLGVQNASDFLKSKALKSLMGEGYTPQVFEVEPDENQLRGQTRIRALPLEVVTKYWLWQVSRGNKQAMALVDALMTETLERRFDRAFGVTRSEDDWDKRLSDRIIQQLENDLSSSMAETDAATNRERLLEQQLRELGYEPWALPNDEQEDS